MTHMQVREPARPRVPRVDVLLHEPEADRPGWLPWVLEDALRLRPSRLVVTSRTTVPEPERVTTSLREVLVRVTVEVDVATADRVADRVEEALSCRPVQVVLDLTCCPFADSRLASLVLRARRQAARQGTDLVVRPSRQAARVLRLTGVACDAALVRARNQRTRR